MCYTGNLTDRPRPCAPPDPGTRIPFVELIKAGQGMDQAEGSICTALPTAKPNDQGHKAVGCAPGLSCKQIGGPFQGTPCAPAPPSPSP